MNVRFSSRTWRSNPGIREQCIPAARGTVEAMTLVGQIAELQNYTTYKEIAWEGSFED